MMGRFMSPDPSQLFYADSTNPQSFNLYGYVQNNPLTNTDPTGLALQLSCYNDPDTATTSTDAKGNTTITTTAGAQHCTAWDDGQGRYTGTLPQLRLASFTPPSPAPNNGMSRYPFPANAVPCSTNSGANFMAPPGFSVSNISANGQTNGLTGAGAAVGQFGYYDYQRYVTGPAE
jgi:hypothetical protein